MIKPIVPIVPDLSQHTFENTSKIIPWLTVLIISGLSAFIISRYSAEKFKGNKKKSRMIFLSLSLVMSMLLMCFFGCTAIAIKGVILSLIFMTAAYQDIKTHECDDYIHPMILITGLLGLDYSDLPNMIISAIVVYLMLLIPLCFTKSDIGGADIKFSVACSFALGVKKGLFGLIVGLVVAVVLNFIKKDQNKGFPMIPYLAVGFMTAYFV